MYLAPHERPCDTAPKRFPNPTSSLNPSLVFSLKSDFESYITSHTSRLGPSWSLLAVICTLREDDQYYACGVQHKSPFS